MNNKIYLEKNKDTYIHSNNLFMQYYIFDEKLPIVITFGPLGTQIDNEDIQNSIAEAWGFKFIKSQGLNVISFGWTGKNTWYRDHSTFKFMENLSTELENFPERLGYGGSMGGYAVSAYSNTLKLDRILLINPISTLNKYLVPWETRFRGASDGLDWGNGNTYDGAITKALGYVIYDPLFSPDRRHAERYQNLVKLKIFGVGHQLPLHLKDMKMLKWIFFHFINDTLDKQVFYKKARKRRTLRSYYNWLLSEENTHLTKKRAYIIDTYRKKYFSVLGNYGDRNLMLSDTQIDLFRDSATILEKIDIKKAYDLMFIAYLMRPDGPFIKKKIVEYRRKLRINDNFLKI